MSVRVFMPSQQKRESLVPGKHSFSLNSFLLFSLYRSFFQILCQLSACLYFPYCILVMEFTISRRKSLADSRPFFIDFTVIVAVKVFAPVFDIKIPLSLLNKDGCLLVADVPADIFKIIFRGWFINLHGKIFTAECTCTFYR